MPLNLFLFISLALSFLQVKKKKLWEALAKDLKTDGNKVATWNGKAVMTSAGACTAPTIADAPIA